MLDPSGDSPYGVAVAQRGSDHCFFPQADEGHPLLLGKGARSGEGSLCFVRVNYT